MTQAEAFQAICDLFDWDAKTLTKTSRSRIGGVAKELVEAGATVDEIAYARKAWEQLWEGGSKPTLTDTSLTAWWPELTKRHRQHVDRLEARDRQVPEPMAAEQFEVPLPREENLRRMRELQARFPSIVKEVQ